MNIFRTLYREWKYWANKNNRRVNLLTCDDCSNVADETYFYVVVDKRKNSRKKVIICKGACYDPKS